MNHGSAGTPPRCIVNFRSRHSVTIIDYVGVAAGRSVLNALVMDMMIALMDRASEIRLPLRRVVGSRPVVQVGMGYAVAGPTTSGLLDPTTVAEDSAVHVLKRTGVNDVPVRVLCALKNRVRIRADRLSTSVRIVVAALGAGARHRRVIGRRIRLGMVDGWRRTVVDHAAGAAGADDPDLGGGGDRGRGEGRRGNCETRHERPIGRRGGPASCRTGGTPILMATLDATHTQVSPEGLNRSLRNGTRPPLQALCFSKNFSSWRCRGASRGNILTRPGRVVQQRLQPRPQRVGVSRGPGGVERSVTGPVAARPSAVRTRTRRTRRCWRI